MKTIKEKLMDKARQDKLWNELSEESKEYVLKNYQDNYDIRDKIENWIRKEYEDLFGSHNLNPEPQIKTWEDVMKDYPHITANLEIAMTALCSYQHCPIQYIAKCKATLQIQQLIDLGYGGMVSDEEWKDDNKEKYVITPSAVKTFEYKIATRYYTDDIHFIAFHSYHQAREFMSHESNRQLVQQYFMM